MDRPLQKSTPQSVAYHGEVWTDARGYATVGLPADADRLMPPFEYELRDVEAKRSVRLSAGLSNSRFTIETDQPHVKVAWRISGRRPRHRTEDKRRNS